MKTHNIIIILLLLAPIILFSQGGIVNNGAVLKINSATDVKINEGGVINKNNGTVSNKGNLHIDLDWTQLGPTTNYTGSGWMIFEGNTNQNLSSGNAITIDNLQVNNGNRLILNDDVTVSTQVDLVNNGQVELGVNNLTISSGATITNYDASHFIITNSTGVLEQEVGASNVIFPVGNSTYNPATISNTGTVDNYSLRVEDQVWDNGTSGTPETHDIVNRSWHLSEAVQGGSLATLTLQWHPSEELIGFDRSVCGVAHWKGGAWLHPSSFTPATTVGPYFSQTLSGINDFSPFAVEDINESLPIELLLFKAKREDKHRVKLNWATASETNNKGFEIERMLDTETAFSTIDWVDGAGNSNYLLNYSYTDLNAHSGVSYYRLKQIDFDGSYSYSPIRAVAGLSSSADQIQVYPIPTKDRLMVDFSNWNSTSTDAVLRIIDVHGRTVFTKEIKMQQNNLITINEVADFPPGTYFVTIGNDSDYEMVQKIIKE
ncbi:T9SS type A sorting domain-containing protein [Aureispira anguillae]|uniref:T9SS type A sorting domain-containing protein n=1 Tax=Aureispira anguillae TaxID=2864201 RepID=A0A916DX73_9BACT|nr:T9SS type A sorting domain-containing protein [Aureispira anguillae]BDS15582.1 T9SS type A sorting domain-containing protein [Aureispira anguillae]